MPKLYSNHPVGADILQQLHLLLLNDIQKATPIYVNQEADWWQCETLFSAWINTYRYVVRRKNHQIGELDANAIKWTLRSRQCGIKLVAVEVLQQILEVEKMRSVGGFLQRKL